MEFSSSAKQGISVRINESKKLLEQKQWNGGGGGGYFTTKPSFAAQICINDTF